MSEAELIKTLYDIAPVLGVLAFTIVTLTGVVVFLYKKNETLIEKMHTKDLRNLETLQEISLILSDVRMNQYTHRDQVKQHIDDRVNNIKEVLRNERK